MMEFLDFFHQEMERIPGMLYKELTAEYQKKD